MFKKGDQVRCVKAHGRTSTAGKIYTVFEATLFNPSWFEVEKDDFGNKNYYPQSNFELVTTAQSVSEPFKLGDKIEILKDDPQGADVKCGEIGIIYSFDGQELMYKMPNGKEWFIGIKYEGILFARVDSGINNTVASTIPNQGHKCHCVWRDVLMNGCQCGGS